MDNVIKGQYSSKNWSVKQLIEESVAHEQALQLWRAKRLLLCATLAWLRAKTGRFDTKSFQYKSFWYKLKQWNCTKILFTLSIVCEWTRKHFGWISSFFKPSMWNYLHLEWINLYANDLYRDNIVSKRPVTLRATPPNVELACRLRVRLHGTIRNDNF